MPDDLNQAGGKSPLERLREKIESLPDQPSGMIDLGRALVGSPDLVMEDCAACQDILPEYIEAELNGQPVRKLYPQAARHLDICPDCGRMFVDLLEVAIRMETEPPPIYTPIPAFDLSFLPPLVFPERLWQVVEKFSKVMVDRLIPEFQAGFASASKSFLRQIKKLKSGFRLEIGQQLVLSFGTEISPAIQSIAAVYAATDSIVSSLSEEVLNKELSGIRPPRQIKKLARSSARAMGFGKGVNRWVEEYVLLAQANADDILDLARRMAGNER